MDWCWVGWYAPQRVSGNQELWHLPLWRKVKLVAANNSYNGSEVQENTLYSKEGNTHSMCEKEISGSWQGIHTPVGL